MEIRRSRPEERDALVDVWLRAVRATHDFLREEDVAFYLPLVRDGALPGLEVWVLEDDAGRPVGWMGLAGAKVEALFIAPEFHRRGGGAALIAHARRRHGELTLDVNEQNDGARRVYAALGFREEGRSPLDGSGRPFPLLHLRLPADAPAPDARRDRGPR